MALYLLPAYMAFITQRILLDIKNKLISNAEYDNFFNNLN